MNLIYVAMIQNHLQNLSTNISLEIAMRNKLLINFDLEKFVHSFEDCR